MFKFLLDILVGYRWNNHPYHSPPERTRIETNQNKEEKAPVPAPRRQKPPAPPVPREQPEDNGQLIEGPEHDQSLQERPQPTGASASEEGKSPY